MSFSMKVQPVDVEPLKLKARLVPEPVSVEPLDTDTVKPWFPGHD